MRASAWISAATAVWTALAINGAQAAAAPGATAEDSPPAHISLPLRHLKPDSVRSDSHNGSASFQRRLRSRSSRDLAAWANTHRAKLRKKYGLSSQYASHHPDSASHSDQASPEARDVRAPYLEAGLTNFKHDSSWSTTIYIGTPPRPYDVLVDTGSADLWLSADHFDPSQSSTFVREQGDAAVFQVQYGSGNVSGFVGRDVVQMGGGGDAASDQAGITMSSPTFLSPKQSFAVATTVTSTLKASTLTAGILGFAFESLASVDSPPFWLQANLTKRQFGIYLERQLTSLTQISDVDSAPGGTLTLGGVDRSLFVPGTENAIDVLEQAYWLIPLAGLGVAGQSIPLGDQHRTAIDTGTTLIGGPDDIIANLYAHIPGSRPMEGAPGYYLYPCTTPPSTLRIHLAFGHTAYRLPDIDFVGDIASDDLSMCLGAFFGLGTVPGDRLHWIAGAAFLKNVYAMFDAGELGGGTAQEGGGGGQESDDDAKIGTKAQVIFASLAQGLNSGTQTSTLTANGFIGVDNGASASTSAAVATVKTARRHGVSRSLWLASIVGLAVAITFLCYQL